MYKILRKKFERCIERKNDACMDALWHAKEAVGRALWPSNLSDHECIETMKEKIAVHTLRAPKSQCSDETLIMLQFSQDELRFIMEKAQYHADLAVHRMFDLGDGERARSICQKALRIWTEEVA